MSEKPPTIEISGFEQTPSPKVDIETEYTEFIPQEFLNDPVGYFEREGKNIKSGEKKIDEDGIIHDDPTAVKDFPVWENDRGEEIFTVAKRIDTTKGKVGKSGDPFYEYEILQKLGQMNLPAAKTVAKVAQEGTYIFLTERIPGTRWSELKDLHLQEKGYSSQDIDALMTQAEEKMVELKTQFDKVGVIRKWKLKDMVFQIDIENKKVTALIPTDWERTKIDSRKLETSANQAGIDFVFEKTPELSEIGTKEQYQKYLETIFPNSTTGAKIFQHQTKYEFNTFSNDKFSSGRLGKGHYFSNFGNNYLNVSEKPNWTTKTMVLNIQNPKHMPGGDYMKNVYSIIDERGLSENDEVVRSEVEKEYTEELKQQYDALIGDKNGNLQSETLVFDKDQIYILGSHDDIQKFREFVAGDKLSTDSPASV